MTEYPDLDPPTNEQLDGLERLVKLPQFSGDDLTIIWLIREIRRLRGILGE